MQDARFSPAASLVYYWGTVRCEVRAEAKEKADDIDTTNEYERHLTVFRYIDHNSPANQLLRKIYLKYFHYTCSSWKTIADLKSTDKCESARNVKPNLFPSPNPAISNPRHIDALCSTR